MEAIDVADGVYPAAYDANGRCIAITVERESGRGLFGLVPVTTERVVLSPAESPDAESPLRDMIAEHLDRLGFPLRAPNMPLSEVVGAFVTCCGYTAD